MHKRRSKVVIFAMFFLFCFTFVMILNIDHWSTVLSQFVPGLSAYIYALSIEGIQNTILLHVHYQRSSLRHHQPTGIFHFVFGASPQRFLCHFPNKIASFPQQFASFPQQNCFISPTTWVTSPTTCVTSPTHFLISPTTLCHFAPHQKIMICLKKILGFHILISLHHFKKS